MQTLWLHRQDRADCLLFFSGWGMDGEPFRFLASERCDVLLVHDYRWIPEQFDFSPVAHYARLHLAAWSMGVWVAARLLAAQAERFATRLALAGTLWPIDGQRGIPPERYQALCRDCGESAVTAFYDAMFNGDLRELQRFLQHRPQPGLSDLRAELLGFQRDFAAFGPGKDIFTRKIVTSRDRIFSARNQMRCWGKEAALLRNWPHFPFFSLTDWQELLLSGAEKTDGGKRTELLT